jgi:ADP-ribosylation factor-binding protein GGA
VTLSFGSAMEAASARMAARERYGAYAEAPVSQLQRFIRTIDPLPRREYKLTMCEPVQACDPQNFEPNLALNLEITDLINNKKGSA